MKKGTKIALGSLSLLLGAIVLSSCTASFCNNKDMANMMYLYDYGVTSYYDETAEGRKELEIEGVTFTNKIYYSVSYDDAYGINNVDSSVANADSKGGRPGFKLPSLSYWEEFDKAVLKMCFETAGITTTGADFKAESITRGWSDGFKKKDKGLLDNYGYLKFYDNEGDSLWANWDKIDADIRKGGKVSLDECPSSDYINSYKSTMNGYVSANRSCLAINTGDYGEYGPHSAGASIEGKTWGSAFSKTNFLWLEGILVWPMGAFVDVLAEGMLGGGVASGWAQLLAILIITVIVRSLMLLVTWKQSSSTAKMNELQPQIAKIQAKYPNANTNNYEKQRQAQEMADLYKKNKINPLSSILVLFIQFPVFICVWAALQGSSILSSGTLFGLNFSTSISSMLFNAEAWKTGGAVAALVLFLLMAAAQVVSMLLPQWLQKAKAKKIAKLGKNPAKKEQDNKMKWFTYIMCGMIIIMGFSLASGMGVYWFIGALFSIGQTLIMNKVNDMRAKKHK